MRAGARHWAIFSALCHRVGARGNVVPDAFHAALAIENGATWITTDRGFAQFPGLRWRPCSTSDCSARWPSKSERFTSMISTIRGFSRQPSPALTLQSFAERCTDAMITFCVP